MEIRTVELAEQPYLYVDGSAPSDPAAIAQAMGAAFGKVMAFLGAHGIAPAGQPLSVYYTYDPEEMDFRAGLPVARDALKQAAGEVHADVTPAGRMLHATHVGPYATLLHTYDAMMAHAEREGLALSAPAWESYVDDPAQVPESRLRTEIYMVVDD